MTLQTLCEKLYRGDLGPEEMKDFLPDVLADAPRLPADFDWLTRIAIKLAEHVAYLDLYISEMKE